MLFTTAMFLCLTVLHFSICSSLSGALAHAQQLGNAMGEERTPRSTMMEAFMTRFLRSPTLSEIPIPKPEPNELFIKVAYVALNPTDRTWNYP